MTLSMYACANCGHWQRWFGPPPACPVCCDVRNALPEDGWDFPAEKEVGALLVADWYRPVPGVTGFRAVPSFGLGTTGWLIEAEGGNVAWEAAPYYPPEALSEIERLGGITRLGASHVHGYGALWQLQRRFAPPVVAVGEPDLVWTKAFRVTWPVDGHLELAPGLTLHRTGGHFPGHCVLHDARRGILFCGDALKVDLDDTAPRALSCHKAFHAQIPLSHDEVRHYRSVIGALDFTAVATPFEYAAPVTTADVLRLFDHQLAGPPATTALPMGSGR
ncbi:MBL fold metallo-hydrolase [Streptomyces sp. CRN 30]|uniref:MBL fold metallo-hydrolase n=1 Tax=Streptomyces sp. CRN 30 TaxID=3075613 RepID=UPI002A812AB2|nr:MBL fold metallo-hydrolase [Streptomyces sp. CRN 30]